jgi:hypothetical protein
VDPVRARFSGAVGPDPHGSVLYSTAMHPTGTIILS